MPSSSEPVVVDGPYYDDLSVGDHFDSAPRIALTEGFAAVHHSIVGGRLRLALDRELSARVTREVAPLAGPALVWDVAIGQSTLVTRQAIANLFYRGLMFARAPAIGDTLHTTTDIVGLRPATPKPGRPPRGLVTMRMRTTDQQNRPILDFHRCAMLPARAEATGGPSGLVEIPAGEATAAQLSAAIAGWNLTAFRDAVPGPHFAELRAGSVYRLGGGDLVSSAPELARLTLNLAVVHHDRTAAPGGRLVYGGHTIGLALAQVTRALPALVTVVGWHDCDHTGPVREGDTLHSEIAIERCEPLPGGGGLVHLNVLVRATDSAGAQSGVLRWRLVALFA